MKSESDEIEGPQWILTHSPGGGTVAFRVGRWKLIPEIEEFYDIENDPEEKQNLFEDDSVQAKIENMQTWLTNIHTRIDTEKKNKILARRKLAKLFLKQ